MMEEKKKKKEEKENQGTKEELEKLKKELEKCQKKEKEYLTGWQRERADFLNYRKKELENLESIKKSAEETIILELVKIFDSFEKAKQSMPDEIKNSEWGKGFLGIERQFNGFLEKIEIEKIGRKGEEFNPNIHEAVMEVDSQGEKSGVVVEILETGYTRNGRIIRPAKVKVSK